MKCIILAAGYATRLYPLTENFPKPLLPVGGKPIIEWLIEDINSAADEFIIVTNHKFADQFNQWVMANVMTIRKRTRVIDDGTSTNETRLGAVKDIVLAVDMVGEDDYLVMAGDNVLDFSLLPFIEYSQSSGTSCVMCHEETDIAKLRKTAVIATDGDGLITSYEEKPKEPKGHLAVPPFYFYRADDVRRIPEALESGVSPDAPGSFAAWLSGKVRMHAWKMTGSRHDIGDMASYSSVRDSYKGPEKHTTLD